MCSPLYGVWLLLCLALYIVKTLLLITNSEVRQRKKKVSSNYANKKGVGEKISKEHEFILFQMMKYQSFDFCINGSRGVVSCLFGYLPMAHYYPNQYTLVEGRDILLKLTKAYLKNTTAFVYKREVEMGQ